MTNTIESKVVDAILQRATDTLEIDGVKYPVGAPSAATLFLVSEAVAGIDSGIDTTAKTAERIVVEVLRTAKDFRVIGAVAAILILGAERVLEKRLVKKKEAVLKRRFSIWRGGAIPVRKEEVRIVEEKDALAERILLTCRAGILKEIIVTRLNHMEIGAFFGLSTSLAEINILKPTKGGEEVEQETTALGE